MLRNTTKRKTPEGRAQCNRNSFIWNLKNKYGINEEIYNSIVEKQNMSCAICKKITPLERLCVDHNHSNGKVRGLLCRKCNAGLGLFDDSKSNILNALIYINKLESINDY